MSLPEASGYDTRFLGPNRGSSPYKDEVESLVLGLGQLLNEWPLAMDEHHRLSGACNRLAAAVHSAMLPEPGSTAWIVGLDGIGEPVTV